ncbi:MAG: hypothetical protein A4E62_02352 [Syntrophorhabdus sp. PtaU1.Bin002]|nr:MAG: hypothetical protein A4E58_00719 [Syntrophorhabdus sp. PtaB.Bin006]OPY67086.1 MAG: hypothetical protein A4E62_02352 [Syntrophorhabdus sp. PtaU1.Bin002]
MGAIGHVAENDDFSTAIQPTYVIRGAAVDNDLCAEHPHAADALSRRSLNGYGDGFIEPPETAAYTLLPIGNHVQFGGPVPYGFPNLFVEGPGINPFAVFVAQDQL